MFQEVRELQNMYSKEFDGGRLDTGKMSGFSSHEDDHSANIFMALSIFSEDKKGLDSMRMEPGKPHGGSWGE